MPLARTDRQDEWFALKVGVTRENAPTAEVKVLLTVMGGKPVYTATQFEGVH
jgi:hypothetical protein